MRALACAALALSCSEERAAPATPPVYDADVAPILAAKCVSCHGASAPAAGWSATSFLGAIACIAPSDAPATLPADARAPILTALATPPHVGLLDASESALLAAWVAAGTPGFRNGVHPSGIADPRSSDFHGTLLRSSRWQPMLDGSDANACGRCHDGTPSRPAGVTLSAPGATACTSCHTEPQGVLGCDTCHGSGGRAYPPRDPCFFPADAVNAGAHAAHVQSSPARAGGFVCSTCHPVPGSPVIGGLHGDGTVEVTFDAAQIGPEASFDNATGVCAVTCHDSGGARPRPAWSDTVPMGCSDCHGSPPAGHYPGSCTNCHKEANATGTALSGGPLHLDGRVELGDGSGTCGACHGSGTSPWPSTAAHAAHQDPTIATAVACASCHPVPTQVTDPLHLDGAVHVTFTGLAVARGAEPKWNGSSCSAVACHGANLADPPSVVPVWTDSSGAASKCGACHPIPPSQHTPSTSCSWSNCHGAEIGQYASGEPFITASGKTLHVNGAINYE